MFIDFISAFNTIQPHVIVKHYSTETFQINGVIGFRISHKQKQCVKVENVVSSMYTTNIGAPQGCVLSSMLFVIYTSQPGCIIYKYADNTVILGNDTNHSTDRRYQMLLPCVKNII